MLGSVVENGRGLLVAARCAVRRAGIRCPAAMLRDGETRDAAAQPGSVVSEYAFDSAVGDGADGGRSGSSAAGICEGQV
jgi:hypothetical protein